MRLVLAMTALTSLFASADALACTCIDEGPFLTASEGHSLIVAGTVVAYQPGKDRPVWMDIDVASALRGTAPETLRVYGDNGIECLRYVTGFPLDSTHVWALTVTEERVQISVCGEHAVAWDPGTDVVTGRVGDDVDSLPVADLQAALGPPGEVVSVSESTLPLKATPGATGCSAVGGAAGLGLGWLGLGLVGWRRRR